MSTTARNQRRRNKSICEKTTEIAINITKLSSFYLGRMTLGSRVPSIKRQGYVEVPVMTVVAQELKSKPIEVESIPKLESKPKAKAKAKAKLFELKPESEVDTRAAEFIKRFKKRNQQMDPAAHKEAIPPPPKVKWANHYDH